MKKLIKKLQDRKFGGYITLENIKSAGGYGLGAGATGVLASYILRNSFETNNEESQRLENLEESLSDLKLRKEIIDESKNLIGIESWYEDDFNKLIISVTNGFLLNKHFYYRGFGYPRIYNSQSGENILALLEKADKCRTEATVALFSTLPISIVLNQLVNAPAALTYMGMTIAYGLYNAWKGDKQTSLVGRIKSIVSGKSSIEKLSELCSI